MRYAPSIHPVIGLLFHPTLQCVHRASLFGLPISLVMQVVATFSGRLFFFDRNAIFFREWILSDARHLPGNFHARRTASYLKAVIFDLFANIKIGSRRSDSGELIAEIAIEGFKPFRQFDIRFATGIQYHDAVVDVHHVWAFDK